MQHCNHCQAPLTPSDIYRNGICRYCGYPATQPTPINPTAITVDKLRKALEGVPGELKVIIFDIRFKIGNQAIGAEHIKLEPNDKPWWAAPTFTLYIDATTDNG